MARDLEPRASIVLTEEAEAALRRVMLHQERRLRAGAVESAVRRRGTPAEVTASDVQRADFMLRRRPALSQAPSGVVREIAYPFRDEQPGIFEYYQAQEEDELRRKKLQSLPPRIRFLISVYKRIGIALLVAGLPIPFLYDYVSVLMETKGFRIGGAMVLIGLAMLGLSYGAQQLFEIRNLKRRSEMVPSDKSSDA
jgi:hypothetical protein